MTELQWLIKILTKEKLSTHLKDLFIERIGDVESRLSSPLVSTRAIGPMTQAPSTQRILDEIAFPSTPIGAQGSPPVVRAPTPPAPIDKETGRAMVNTGNGTKGPRKF